MRTVFRLLALGLTVIFVVDLGRAEPPKDDVPALIKSLKSKDAKVRIAAADDIGRVGSIVASDVKEAIPRLLELLKSDKDDGVRKAAATALGKIDPDPKEAVPALEEALKDSKAAVRTAAATALGNLGEEAKDALPSLRDAQKDSNKTVSKAASRAIRSITNKKKN
jgi:vesicle coat complex subunit